MKFTIIAAAAFSTAVLATSERRDPQSDVAAILAALRENNPEDADAAAAAMKVKIRSADPSPEAQRQQSSASDTGSVADPTDLDTILAALGENNPDDAAAARGSIQRRQDDVASILAALGENSPDDAAAAASLGQ